jgi:L-threonylcarbamoyladenylate synthase
MKEDIDKAIEVLNNGGIILYPTDTIWGIGCDATNANAVQRIYNIKQRTEDKSMLILVDQIGKIASYVSAVPDIAYDLLEVSDKPLTIIFEGAKNLAPNLPGNDGTIGIRVTNEPFSKMLCQRFRKPIVSTSANISGQPAPTHFAQINQQLVKMVDYVVKHRQTDQVATSPSSVIKLGAGGQVQIIRS